MREIKFRGWFPNTRRMVYTDPFASCPRYMTWNGSVYENGELRDVILLQFTGFVDANGKEIYDGDILKHVGSWCTFCGAERRDVAAREGRDEPYRVVNWEEKSGNWVAGTGRTRVYPPGWDVTKEIIGNIYENPELLKEVTRQE